jgi:hypothetical protein
MEIWFVFSYWDHPRNKGIRFPSEELDARAERDALAPSSTLLCALL